MGRQQAIGWLSAVVCSVALVVAGGLVISSIAVHRYLQDSAGAMQHGLTAGQDEPTPDAAVSARLEEVVSTLAALPGVATASSRVASPVPAVATPTPTTGASDTLAPAADAAYEVSVIMNPDAAAEQSADVVAAMAQQVSDSRVSLTISAPAGDGHAASVVEYDRAFDSSVSRHTIQSLSRAVAAVASAPSVTSVHVTVPYTWNLRSGDLQIGFADGAGAARRSLEAVMAGTPLAGVGWERAARG